MRYTYRGPLGRKKRASAIDHPAQGGRSMTHSWRVAKNGGGGFENGAADALHPPENTGAKNRASAIDHPAQGAWSMAYSWRVAENAAVCF